MSANESSLAEWRPLLKLGGIAAMLAGIIFRRHFAAEVGLFSAIPMPATLAETFELLQTHRLLALLYLDLVDVINYSLLLVMFLAVTIVLRKANPSLMTLALMLGVVGITIYLTSNTMLSMLALSGSYAATSDPAQQAQLLGAGEALHVLNRFHGAGAQPSTGGYVSLLFVALAGMLTSVTMLQSDVFGRVAAIVGIITAGLDLAYCVAYALLPIDARMLSLIFIPAAGLGYLVWHTMVGWRLWRLGRQQTGVISLPG